MRRKMKELATSDDLSADDVQHSSLVGRDSSVTNIDRLIVVESKIYWLTVVL